MLTCGATALFASTSITAATAEDIKIGLLPGYTGPVESMMVAISPGIEIYPGELAKGLKILAEGGEIDYVGASAVEFIGGGDSAGNYRQVLIKGGKMTTVAYR